MENLSKKFAYDPGEGVLSGGGGRQLFHARGSGCEAWRTHLHRRSKRYRENDAFENDPGRDLPARQAGSGSVTMSSSVIMTRDSSCSMVPIPLSESCRMRTVCTMIRRCEISWDDSCFEASRYFCRSVLCPEEKRRDLLC